MYGVSAHWSRTVPLRVLLQRKARSARGLGHFFIASRAILWSGPRRRYTSLEVERRACAAAAAQRPFVMPRRVATMDTHQPTHDYVTALRAAGISGEPCDDLTVRDLEQQLGVSLPAAYRAFLLVAGHGFPTWTGSHHTVDDDLPELQRTARRLLKERGASLPTDAFVFLIHQGAAVQFFLLGDGDDPAVFQWVDFAEPQPIERTGRNFTGLVVESKRQIARRRGGA